MSELMDRPPMQHYGDMFVSQDLRMSLESQMFEALQEAVDRGWYTEEEAATEYAVWHHQFD